MSTPRSLRTNVSWTLVSNIVYGLYQWVLIAILASISGASAVGEYSLALAVVGPVNMFFNFQLRALQASDAEGEFSFKTYFSVRILGIIATAVVVLGALAIGLVPSAIALPVLGVLAYRSVEGVSDIIYGLFQRAERLDLSSKSRLIESLVGLVAFASVFAATHNIFTSLLAVALGLVAVLVLVTLPALQRISSGQQPFWSGKKVTMGGLLGLMALGVPLGITMSLSSVNAALPRFLLERFTDTASVGIYAGINQLVVSGVILTGAIGQAITPRLSQLFVAGNVTAFKRMVNRLILVGAGIGLAGTALSWLMGAEVLRLVYSPEYADHASVLIIQAGSTVFLFAASFQGYALTAARVIRSQVSMLLMVIPASLITLLLLVPRWGIEGAAMASVVGAFVQFVASAIFLNVRLRQVSKASTNNSSMRT